MWKVPSSDQRASQNRRFPLRRQLNRNSLLLVLQKWLVKKEYCQFKVWGTSTNRRQTEIRLHQFLFAFSNFGVLFSSHVNLTTVESSTLSKDSGCLEDPRYSQRNVFKTVDSRSTVEISNCLLALVGARFSRATHYGNLQLQLTEFRISI